MRQAQINVELLSNNTCVTCLTVIDGVENNFELGQWLGFICIFPRCTDMIIALFHSRSDGGYGCASNAEGTYRVLND